MNFESAFLGPQSIQVCHLRSKTPLTAYVDRHVDPTWTVYLQITPFLHFVPPGNAQRCSPAAPAPRPAPRAEVPWPPPPPSSGARARPGLPPPPHPPRTGRLLAPLGPVPPRVPSSGSPRICHGCRRRALEQRPASSAAGPPCPPDPAELERACHGVGEGARAALPPPRRGRAPRGPSALLRRAACAGEGRGSAALAQSPPPSPRARPAKQGPWPPRAEGGPLPPP